MLVSALLSPVFTTYTSCSTTNSKRAQLPDLSVILPLDPTAMKFVKSFSVFSAPVFTAASILSGNSGYIRILLCRLSFKYSAHL
jgi:hypothetical protein